MRISDCLTPFEVEAELAYRESRTTDERRLQRYRDLATNRIFMLLGVDPGPSNPDSRPKDEPIPLSCLEGMAHRGCDDGDSFDDRLKPLSWRTDNENPADYDYDHPRTFMLRVERDGFYTKREPGKGLTQPVERQEPVRVKPVQLGPPELLALARLEVADCCVPTVEAGKPPAPLAIPAWPPRKHTNRVLAIDAAAAPVSTPVVVDDSPLRLESYWQWTKPARTAAAWRAMADIIAMYRAPQAVTA